MTETGAITIRPGTRRDAADLAIIDNMASHGLSFAFWQHAVKAGRADDALAHGRQRFGDPASVFGYMNALVADDGEVVLGAVTLYEMPPPGAADETIKRDFPGFASVFELFGRCTGDWFVDSLAVFPPARGQGLASRLLEAGLEKGRASGMPHASLVVKSDNAAAVCLYERYGFQRRERLPFIVADGKADSAREWLLMSRPLSSNDQPLT